MGLDNVDILLIHDPDNHYDQAMDGAYKALSELRSQGVVGAIGAGMNQWEMEAQLAREGDFDCFLLAGRYTLLDHTALPEFLPTLPLLNNSARPTILWKTHWDLQIIRPCNTAIRAAGIAVKRRRRSGGDFPP